VPRRANGPSAGIDPDAEASGPEVLPARASGPELLSCRDPAPAAGHECGPEASAGRPDGLEAAELLPGPASRAGRRAWYCCPWRGFTERSDAPPAALFPVTLSTAALPFAMAALLISCVEASASSAGLVPGSGRSAATEAQ
jgi:hypothetical protein